MKHVGVHADMRGVVDIPELGLVGSVVDELIITLFLGCLRGSFVDIGVALLGEGVISISHPEYSPSVSKLSSSGVSLVDGCVDRVVTFSRDGNQVFLRHGHSRGIASEVSRTCSCRVHCVRCPSNYH